ncbi:hypothetical protein [Marinobacterium lutimaris]|uniref:Uncharacterized protein n=1 Tax=Marinobacterium lutimaris TaxID=568106 RepID=A0A1H5TWR6_9GAMM|nr:hypothetical protein [Marinobacterium lutimaris]SEF67190.1 hypothetical protein SAMN05444390_101192 [Marinobacterium lutimaris]
MLQTVVECLDAIRVSNADAVVDAIQLLLRLSLSGPSIHCYLMYKDVS